MMNTDSYMGNPITKTLKLNNEAILAAHPLHINWKYLLLDFAMAGCFFAARHAFSFAGIALITLLILVSTTIFKHHTLLTLCIFSIAESIVYSYGHWWIVYFCVWLLLYFAAFICKRNRFVLFWALLAGIFGTLYGLLCAFPYILNGEMGIMSWWFSGVESDVMQGIKCSISVLLFMRPLHMLFARMNSFLQKH